MNARRITAAVARGWLPKRPVDANKGSVGRVYVLAGSRGMIGAAVLSATGAVEAGAGLVRLGTVRSQLEVAAKRVPLEVTVDDLPEDAGLLSGEKFSAIKIKLEKFMPTVVASGPGLGVSAGTRMLVRRLMQQRTPLVLDADGLNAVAPLHHDFSHLNVVLATPHPGELARLLGISTKAVQKDRIAAAIAGARKLRGICLLKGAKTVITDGSAVWINTTGNPMMASGGMGDLLTGIIAALWGQFPVQSMESGFRAAALAAFIHGRAGDLAARHRGGLSIPATVVAGWIGRSIETLKQAVKGESKK